MTWIKVQTSLISDPDYLAMPVGARLLWHELLCLWGRDQRVLPHSSSYVGAQLGLRSQQVGQWLAILMANDFICLCDRTAKLHNELPSLEKKRVDKKREKEPPISPLEGDKVFAEFWEMYPRQRRGNKQKAWQAWLRATERAPPADIIVGLRGYCASDEVRRGFAKGAAAWLNDDRWTTDYLTFREKTMDDMREEFLNGDQGDGLAGDTIDGECVDVSGQRSEADGGSLLPRTAGHGGRRCATGNDGVVEPVAEGESAEASGLEDNRRRIAALAAKAAQASKE